MCFKDINRWDVVKMRDDVVPRINPIWEKNTIHVSVCFTSYSMKSIYCFDCTRVCENEEVYF